MMDWPAVRIFHAIGMPSASRPAVILRRRHRSVEVVADVLFARPDELHRLPDLLRDQHRLPHEILEDAAPAEAASEHHLVNHDLARRHAGGVGRDRERRLAVLGGRPDLDQVGGHMRRAVLRLHGRVREKRHLIIRFDALGRRASAASTSPSLAADAHIAWRSSPACSSRHGSWRWKLAAFSPTSQLTGNA